MSRFGTGATTRRRTASTGSVPPQCPQPVSIPTDDMMRNSHSTQLPLAVIYQETGHTVGIQKADDSSIVFE